jgi:hypothetical protein
VRDLLGEIGGHVIENNTTVAQTEKFLSGSGSGAQTLRKKHQMEMAVARTNLSQGPSSYERNQETRARN